MPEETQVEDATFEDLDENHPALKALHAVRTELRTEKARVREFFEVQSKFPDLGLLPDDFKGLKPEEYEARAQRLSSLKGNAPAPTPPEPPALTDTPQKDAFARMQAPIEGTPPSTEGPMVELNEAFALFKRDPVQFEALKAAGRIKNWPEASDARGGAVRFGG